jgi:predicted MFS family arabinose efflux permease
MTMLFGVVFFSHQIGSFLGAWLGALAFDHLGSYDVIWFASIGLGILSGVCHLFIDERPVGRLRTNTPATTPAE